MPIGKDNKRVAYYYDEEVGNFYYGPNHPMKPHRIRMTHSLVVNYGLFKKMEIFRPYRLLESDMTIFHADDYVHFLKTVTPDNKENWGKSVEKYNIDVDCPIFDGLFRFCQISSGGSVGGAYKLNHGSADIAINWAGGLHHAKKSEASGFCYMNDINLAILELLKHHARVLYVDIDIHHGDGVEEAFYTTDRVMTVSFHKYGDFFPGTGALEDVGIDRGEGYSLNVPLDEGMNDDSFHYIFKPIIKNIIEKFDPNAIVMQMGADSLAGDRLGCFNLTVRGHGECLSYVRAFGLPILVLGGGGYTLRNVARVWTHETGISTGIELDESIPYHEYYEYFAPDYILSSMATNMVNVNKRERLDELINQIKKYLKGLPCKPNGGIHDRVKDNLVAKTGFGEERVKEEMDLDEEKNADKRLVLENGVFKDRMKSDDSEFYSDEKDQDGGNREDRGGGDEDDDDDGDDRGGVLHSGDSLKMQTDDSNTSQSETKTIVTVLIEPQTSSSGGQMSTDETTGVSSSSTGREEDDASNESSTTNGQSMEEEDDKGSSEKEVADPMDVDEDDPSKEHGSVKSD